MVAVVPEGAADLAPAVPEVREDFLPHPAEVQEVVIVPEVVLALVVPEVVQDREALQEAARGWEHPGRRWGADIVPEHPDLRCEVRFLCLQLGGEPTAVVADAEPH